MNAKSASESNIEITKEVRQLAAGLKANHDEAVMSVACLVELTGNLLRAFGQRHGVSVQTMLDLHDALVLNWLSARGSGPLDLDAARREIARAGQTAKYLDSLPN